MSVYKRGDRWYTNFRVRANGTGPVKRVRQVIPEARTKWQAQRAEDKIRDAMFEGTYGSKRTGEQLLSDFIENEYLPWARQNKRSWKNDESRVKHITESEIFKGKTLAEISPLLIEKFKRERAKVITRHKRPPHPATINHDLALLSKAFSLAIESGVADSNPVRKVKRLEEGGGRTRYLSPEEEVRLMAQLVGWKAYLKPIVKAALLTGMRQNEILMLRWSHVDFKRDLIFVADPKWARDPRKTKGIPVNAELKRILLKQRAKSTNEYVFPGRANGHRSPTGVSSALRLALRAAKVTGFRFHDFRHTFGTRLGEANVSPFVIAELMGHASIKMTSRYIHPSEAGKRAAVEVLSKGAENSGHKLVTDASRKEDKDAA